VVFFLTVDGRGDRGRWKPPTFNLPRDRLPRGNRTLCLDFVKGPLNGADIHDELLRLRVETACQTFSRLQIKFMFHTSHVYANLVKEFGPLAVYSQCIRDMDADDIPVTFDVSLPKFPGIMDVRTLVAKVAWLFATSIEVAFGHEHEPDTNRTETDPTVRFILRVPAKGVGPITDALHAIPLHIHGNSWSSLMSSGEVSIETLDE
jgi:hypothetical protein